MNIELYLTPSPFSRAELENKTVVVIDVLRSSTSICAAFMAGARAIIPADGPGEAGELFTKIGKDNAVLAGERNGVKIENFQLGNSPTEFTAEAVGNRFVILTTTNGTAVFSRTNKAGRVISAALVNISKVSERVAKEGRDTVIVCSGQEGQFSIEDTICGGMLISLLTDRHNQQLELNDAAKLALLLYQTNKARLHESVAQGEHGKFLASIGFIQDCLTAAKIDSMPVLPLLKDGQLIIESPT